MHADTAWALGDQFAVGFTSQRPTGPRFGHYTVVSRSNVAAAYLAVITSHEVTIAAQQLGETWVVLTERHGSTHSLLFVVRQRPARVRISANPFQGYVKGKTAGAASVWFVNVDYLPRT